LLGAQEEVARRIAAGEPARKVIAEALRGKTTTAEGVDATYRRLRRALSRYVPRLAGRVDEIPPARLERWCDDLRAAAVLLGEMVAVVEARRGTGKRPPAADPHRTAAARDSKKGRSEAGTPRRRRTR
jgi:hypothetical protein